MEDFDKIVAAAKKLGLEGADLSNFLRDERQARRDELRRQEELEEKRRAEYADRERAEEEHKRRLEIIQQEREVKEQEILAKSQELQQMMEIEKLKAESSAADESQSFKGMPKFAYFDDQKDDIDVYLRRFERHARSHKWPETQWAQHLSTLLKSGRAAEVCLWIPDEKENDYDTLKTELLKRFRMTDEGYREKFRNTLPSKGEGLPQFITKISNHADRWWELAKIGKTYEALRDLIIQEQVYSCMSRDVKEYVKQKKPKSLDEMRQHGETYLESQGRLYEGWGVKSRLPLGSITSRPQPTQLNVKDNQKQAQAPKKKRCFKCGSLSHMMDGCKTGSEYKKSTTGKKCFWCGSEYHLRDKCKAEDLVRKSGVAGAACACFGDDEEEVHISSACTVENHFPSVSLCKDENILVHASDQVMLEMENGATEDLMLCNPVLSLKQENMPDNMPVREGRANGQVVQVLRDTGCSSAVNRKSLCKPEDFTGKIQYCWGVHGKYPNPVALVDIDSPYFIGKAEALAVENPPYDVLLGNNLPGVRRADEPDENWTPKNESLLNIQKCTVLTRQQVAQEKERKFKPLRVMEIQGIQINKEEMKELQEKDDSLAKCREAARGQNKIPRQRDDEEFVYTKGLLYRLYKEKQELGGNSIKQLVLPTKLRKSVMSVAHDSVMAGHLGAGKTKDRILSSFYWPGVGNDVTRYCQSCDICQKTFPKGRVGKIPLGKIPIIDEPFRRVAVDLVGPLIKTESGNRWILTIVDYATRYPEAEALKHIDTEEVADKLLQVFSRVGLPREIMSDLGTQFNSDLMKEIARLLSIKQLTTTPYHPQCNGLVERFNGTLKRMLMRMSDERPKDWDRYLPALMFAYREVPQESLKFAPFELLYGRTVRGPMQMLKELWSGDVADEETQTTYEYILQLKEKLERTCELATHELQKSSEKQRKHFNKRARARKLQAGDRVLVLLPTENNKLLMRWKGPYEVTKKVNEFDYKVKMEDKERTFHANMLKKYLEREANIAIEQASVVCCGSQHIVVVEHATAMAILGEAEDDLVDPDEMCCPIEAKEDWNDVKFDQSLTDAQLAEAKHLVEQFKDVLTDLPGKTDLIECEIHLTDDRPVMTRQYPVPLATREKMKEEVEKMEKMGVIEDSTSSYRSPSVLVAKPDGSNRYCTDFRRLNAVTRFDAEPMPNQEMVINSLGQSNYLTKIDLTKGFWQIPMKDEHKQYTAFSTESGLKQYRYMPFGLVNATAVFNRMVRKLLVGLENVRSYVDDIIIHTETWEKHLKVVQQVLERLRKHHLTARPTKMAIGCTEVQFLGYSVGRGRLKPQEQKVLKIMDTVRPRVKKELRSFLGMTGFYQKFIPSYATIARPLTDLTSGGKKMPNELKWTTEAEKAFETLKSKLCEHPILKIAEAGKTFILCTDASDVGIGGVLLQMEDGDRLPVFYISRKLRGAEVRYSTIEKECLALVWSIKHLHAYLYGQEFILETDHQPLNYLYRSNIDNSRVMRWALALQPYRYKVVVIRGKDNSAADYLSRCGRE